MRVKSRGLGRKELVMDFREYAITRDGDDIVVSGTISEPVNWDFSIRMTPDDLPGMLKVASSPRTFGLGMRWVAGLLRVLARWVTGRGQARDAELAKEARPVRGGTGRERPAREAREDAKVPQVAPLAVASSRIPQPATPVAADQVPARESVAVPAVTPAGSTTPGDPPARQVPVIPVGTAAEDRPPEPLPAVTPAGSGVEPAEDRPPLRVVASNSGPPTRTAARTAGGPAGSRRGRPDAKDDAPDGRRTAAGQASSTGRRAAHR